MPTCEPSQRRERVAGGPVEIRKCRAAEIFDDPASVGLFAEYAAECVNPVIGAPATPEVAMYEAMEGVGFGRCFGAYVAGELCGFAFVMAGALPGYAAPHARVERIFVSDRVRAVGLGRKLMAAIEDSAKSEGCEDISYSAPAGSRLARLLFLQSGDYVNTNHIFCRSLA